METVVYNTTHSIGYIKCGEILKAERSLQDQYILRCVQCKEIYLLLESFIYHLNDSCKIGIADEVNIVNELLSFEKCPLREENTDVEMSSSMVKSEITLEDYQCYAANDLTLVNDEETEKVSDKCEGNNLSTMKKLCDSHDYSGSTFFHTEDPLKAIKSENMYEKMFKPVKDEINLEDEENALISCKKDYETVAAMDNLYNKDYEYQSSGDEKNSPVEDEEISKKKFGNDLGHNNKLSALVELFLKTKEYLITLIEAYKSHPCLWNENFPILKYKIKRQSYLKKIAEELNERYDLSITWGEVANITTYLCRKYREDLKHIRADKGYRDSYTPPWFFEHLDFLQPSTENNPIAKLDSHLPDLLPNQVIKVLEIYKGFPCLWNSHLIEYYCNNKITIAKNEMMHALEAKIGLKITEKVLDDYLCTIKNCFKRAKRNKLDNKGANTEETTHEVYYKYMHFLNDHVGSYFSCSECHRSFKSPLFLKLHKAQEHGCEPLSCFLCQTAPTFKSVPSFKFHVQRHAELPSHCCKECGKKCSNSTELRVHTMIQHTRESPYTCEICGVSFEQIQTFRQHHRSHTKKKFPFTCKICNKHYISKNRYDDHMDTHSNKCNHLCKVCGKEFKYETTMRAHLATHSDVRYRCNVCDKRVKHKTTLNAHMLTHVVTEGYSCEICEKKFKSKYELDRHMTREHSKNHELVIS